MPSLPAHPLNRDEQYVFSTEGHPFRISDMIMRHRNAKSSTPSSTSSPSFVPGSCLSPPHNLAQLIFEDFHPTATMSEEEETTKKEKNNKKKTTKQQETTQKNKKVDGGDDEENRTRDKRVVLDVNSVVNSQFNNMISQQVKGIAEQLKTFTIDLSKLQNINNMVNLQPLDTQVISVLEVTEFVDLIIERKDETVRYRYIIDASLLSLKMNFSDVSFSLCLQ